MLFLASSRRTGHREARSQGSQWPTSTYESLSRHPQASSFVTANQGTNAEGVGHNAVSHNIRGWKARAFAAYVIVIIGTITASIVSALVPPDGWDCRNVAEILILFAWLLSAFLDSALSHLLQVSPEMSAVIQIQMQNRLFWCSFAKDLLATIATLGGITTSMLGISNQCDCYTRWGRTGLALPQMPKVADTLHHQVDTVYPGLVFACLGIEMLVVPVCILVLYFDALRVFLQRDDGDSNMPWLWILYNKRHWPRAALRKSVSGFKANLASLRKLFQSGPRKGTLNVTEDGGQPPQEHSHVSTEWQPLTEQQSLTEEPENTCQDIEMHEMALSPGNMYNELVAAQLSMSRSSGMQPPLQSGVSSPSTTEPRRRLTEQQGQPQISGGQLQEHRTIIRKPVPRKPVFLPLLSES